MKDILKQKIKKYLELYPDTVILDEERTSVEYNSNISVEGGIKFEEEAYVRAYLVAKLIHEYKYPVKNITLEKMYENTMGSNVKNKRTAFLDILVEDDDGNAFMMIECKTPDKFEADMHKIETQLFEPAHYAKRDKKVSYLVYYTLLENQLQDKCIVIDFDKQSNYRDWIKNKYSYNKIPSNYGKVVNALYANVKEECNIGKPLDTSYNIADFSKLRTKLHNYLWGGGSSNYNDIFYYLTHMLLAKIWDERKRKKNEYYEFQIYYVDDMQETYEDTFERIENLYKEAQSKLLNQPKEIINKSTFIDLDKLQLSKVIVAVELLQGISITRNSSDTDVLAHFFESIMSNEFKQDKGQFFTPENLVDFIIEVLEIPQTAIKKLSAGNDPEELLPYIIDPSCGSGTFLIKAMNAISSFWLSVKDEVDIPDHIKYIVKTELFPEYEGEESRNWINKWSEKFIYGIEPNTELATAAKVNMIMQGDGSSNIFINSGLADFEDYINAVTTRPGKGGEVLNKKKKIRFNGKNYYVNEKFDFIITNPPFSLTYGNDKEQLRQYEERFLFPKESEILFIERWYQLLKEGGRIGAILPDSIFDTTSNDYIRLFLLKYFHIKAVVSVDEIAFKPYTSTKVSILFAEKKTKREVEYFEKKWQNASKEYLKIYNGKYAQNLLNNDKILNGGGKINLTKLCKKYDINLPEIKYLTSESIGQKILLELEMKIIRDNISAKLLELVARYEELCLMEKGRESGEAELKEYIKIKTAIWEELGDNKELEFLGRVEECISQNEKILENRTEIVTFMHRLLKNYYTDYYITQQECDCIIKAIDSVKTTKKILFDEIIEEIISLLENEQIRQVCRYQYIRFVEENDLCDEWNDNIAEMLKEYVLNQVRDTLFLVERHYDIIIKCLKLDYPKWNISSAQKKNMLNVNSWWVYNEISKDFKDNIIFAHAEEVGYKRTKKNPYMQRKNELFNRDAEGRIIINTKEPSTILDYIKRERIWDDNI